MKTIPDQATRTGRGTAGPATLPVSPGSWRTGRRRRPTGEPPPLPRHLESTGVGWLVAAVVLVAVSLLVFAAGRYGHGISLTVVDTWVLERLTAWRSPAVTGAMEAVAGLLGSLGTVKAVGAAVLLVLVAFRRFRHLLVAWASLQVVTVLVLGLSILVRRPRPFGVPIEGDWASWAMPSRPVAYLAAILVAMLYTLVPTGRWRQAGKWAATGLVTLLGLARLYLGVDHPSDVLVAAALGVTIPLLAFRWFTPNEVFPVAYRRGRAAHLDVGGARGQAIRRALAEQLGLEVTEIKPFGLSGSAGSTPLRITVKGGTVLFGKLYARSHLRADRWYKLGRELLYGRLEDEKPFNTVRRLVQQEDYALNKLHAAGLPTPRPYGFVELTPDWEYLLVTEFFAGATELGEAEVDQGVIDDGLMVVRKLWEAGLAHRDIKPANLLVRDGRVLLIDVAFAEARPSPWRQAVDLANMMLCLALRSNPELVYRRALHQFSAAEISEGLAATRGLAMPSQLRHLLRAQGRDLHAEFLDLLPQRPRPVSIQRWNLRRVGLALVAALGLVLAPLAVGWTARTDDRMDNSLFTRDVSYSSQEPLWLMAQSVPSAALVPCVQLVPAGWTLADVRVQKGFSQLTFDTDRAGKAAVVVELTASVDLAGAVEVTSEQPGARRYVLVDRDAESPLSSRVYVFDGGAVAIRFTAPTPQQLQRLAGETSSAIGFTTREQLRQALSRRTDGRLRLDPPAAP